MSLIKACLLGRSIKNTAVECNIAMGATAMLIAVPAALEIVQADLDDPIAWITPLLHAGVATRIFPFFGQVAPISTIQNNAEGDVTLTLDDGTQVFLRYGVYNRLFGTINGGLCYAKALQSLNKSGYNIIEIDQQGQMLLAKKSAGVWRGLQTSFMFAPAPLLADLKTTVYTNRFQVSYTPSELVTNGVIFTGASELLALMGLIDAEIVKAAAATTTKLKIGVQTECAETDLVAQLGADLGTHVSNFIVYDKTAGALITPSAAAIVSGIIELTGVYPTGHVINVIGSAPSVWLSNDIEGYDASNNGVDITIP